VRVRGADRSGRAPWRCDDRVGDRRLAPDRIRVGWRVLQQYAPSPRARRHARARDSLRSAWLATASTWWLEPAHGRLARQMTACPPARSAIRRFAAAGLCKEAAALTRPTDLAGSLPS
jgi:hypothetical protein